MKKILFFIAFCLSAKHIKALNNNESIDNFYNTTEAYDITGAYGITEEETEEATEESLVSSIFPKQYVDVFLGNVPEENHVDLATQ